MQMNLSILDLFNYKIICILLYLINKVLKWVKWVVVIIIYLNEYVKTFSDNFKLATSNIKLSPY